VCHFCHAYVGRENGRQFQKGAAEIAENMSFDLQKTSQQWIFQTLAQLT